MSFWKPTQRKLATFALLLLLTLICAAALKLTDKATQQLRVRELKAAVGPESVKAFEAAVRTETDVRVKMMEKIDATEAARIERIYNAKSLVEYLLPIFFAYLAACVIHVKRKSPSPTD